MATMARHPKVRSETVYLGDNGRAYCGDHLGCQAQATMHDLSGQKVEPVSPEDVAYCEAKGWPVPTCEQPGCGRKASRIHLPA